MSRIKWGILSTANIAQTQLIPAIQRSSNAEVLAISSRNNKVYEVAEKFNIPRCYESYEELLGDSDIEAVYIPLPNVLHKEWIIKSARAGKHIMSEKPVTLNAEDAKEVIEVCKENNVLFMEGFMYQFHPQHKRVSELIASGEIGDVKLMKASFSYFMDSARRERDIRMNSEMGGGSIYDVGCYCIHSIRNVLQSEPKEIHVAAKIDEVHHVDTTSTGFMKLENGIPVIFDCSFEMSFRHEYEVIGTKGIIKVPRAYRPDNYGGEGIIIIEKGNERKVERIVSDQYTNEVEYFSNCIREGKNISHLNENTINNMRVIEACYESIHSGETVKLN